MWKVITPHSEMSEYSDCLSTREALQTIFSKASNEQISKYERQLANIKILDPVLIIVPNQNWINLHGLPTYYTVMDSFATNGLRNECRDENSRVIFYFATNTELYVTRDSIENLFPNAFMVAPSLQASVSNPRVYLIGEA
ncbi:21682_t:CDS:2 [Dentiscutata erythropus]|uniref:21682_t:CDS:1 n=1 Tax=Dentiscutata erythropus TaxID=1348616 RepID=A0A9N9P354_9GLOM|nr:21682_t:CDS:2 [Dentiscutata erythropus]